MQTIVARLIKLAASALMESVGGGIVRAAIFRMMPALLCIGLAAVLLLATLGCAATALWNLALPSLGPVGAPLVVAAALSTATLVLAAATCLIMRHNRRGPSTVIASQLLLREATRLVNGHKGAVLLAAVVAGMAAANGGRKS
jgi:hypothetical protein